MEISLTIEDVFYEFDHLSGCRRNNPRSDGVPPIRLKAIHGMAFLWFSILGQSIEFGYARICRSASRNPQIRRA